MRFGGALFLVFGKEKNDMDLSRRKKEFLRVHHLEAETQDNHILKSLTFCLYEGETVGFLEKDDSGMDALLSILCGSEKQVSGKLYLEGREVSGWEETEARKQGIYRIHPESSLIQHMDVAENLCLMRPSMQVPRTGKFFLRKKSLHFLTNEYLEAWGISIDSKKRPESLTRLETLLLLIIKAEMCHAKMLILDHVCEDVIGDNTDAMLRILSTMKSRGITVLIVEKQPDLMLQCAERIMVMDQGNLIGDYYADECSEKLLQIQLGSDDLEYGKNSMEERESEILNQEYCFFWENDTEFIFKAGEVLGIILPHVSWKEFQGKCEILKGREQENKARISVLPGAEASFGIYPELSRAENLNFRILGRIRGKFGMISNRILRFSYGEYFSDHDPWRKSSELGTKEKMQLAIAGCSREDPDIILMDHVSYGLDMENLNDLIQEIYLLSRRGICVLLLNPGYLLARQCCTSVWARFPGKRAGIFSKEDIQEGLLSQYLFFGDRVWKENE